MDIYQRLKELHIVLPPLTAPVAAYVSFVQTGNLVFVSGHIAKQDGNPWVGQLGTNMDTALGQIAASPLAAVFLIEYLIPTLEPQLNYPLFCLHPSIHSSLAFSCSLFFRISILKIT